MKTPFAYSAAQKGAMTDFQSNLCVSAGAGSGKTTVLVERFLHAVGERKIGVDRILAITFTDKAANEMKKTARGSRFIKIAGAIST
jgi:ATP-dependent exoDNAse (exonuclease V) beta subunit